MTGKGEKYFRNQARPASEAMGQSEAFIDFQERLSLAAKVDRPVLIVGDRGTGKELAASRLHYLSHRWEGPLVALNCAALAPTLLETELFGHEAGAFTGANKRRRGRFEAAEGGTLFLDEIGLIPIEVQEKILRVVEYRAFERVGSSDKIEVDVRIIGATNADLPGLARAGKFKEDLLDRLSFEVLYLPALKHRIGDVMLLAQHFAVRMAAELGRDVVPEISEEAIEALESYQWPGNVRELKNVIERAVYREESSYIESIDFDPFRSPYESESGSVSALPTEPASPSVEEETESDASPPSRDWIKEIFNGRKPLNDVVADLELEALIVAMKEGKYQQREAAKLLGLSYHQFRGLFRKYKDQL